MKDQNNYDKEVAKELYVIGENNVNSSRTYNSSYDFVRNSTENIKGLTKNQNRVLRSLVVTCVVILVFFILPIVITGLVIKLRRETANILLAIVCLIVLFTSKHFFRM
jgi:hypothetical protein